MATFMAPIMALIMKIFLRFLAAAQSIFFISNRVQILDAQLSVII